MKQVLIVLVLASAGASLFAMKQDSNHQPSPSDLPRGSEVLAWKIQIREALRRADLETASASSQLRNEHRTRVLEFLLNNGVLVDQHILFWEFHPSGYNTTPLMQSAQIGNAPEVALLLTFIPLNERDKILKERHVFNFIFFTQELTPDMRRMLTRAFINSLVNEQMQRINRILAMKDLHQKTALDYGLENLAWHAQEIGKLLDLSNPVSRERIRMQIENNIRRILFAAPNPVDIETPGP